MATDAATVRRDRNYTIHAYILQGKLVTLVIFSFLPLGAISEKIPLQRKKLVQYMINQMIVQGYENDQKGHWFISEELINSFSDRVWFPQIPIYYSLYILWKNISYKIGSIFPEKDISSPNIIFFKKEVENIGRKSHL
ncbi:hypothetical protein KUTeg_020646 [Tegillarca granosa]|uniref:Uncharacterized protein n=1 Tax=Tegillarca granosa TaxID=220873 RepID=A0ABQ9E8J7_TEGGR|nr:hypothetical protein KUTeg_020646 [Tegillarca granosa]